MEVISRGPYEHPVPVLPPLQPFTSDGARSPRNKITPRSTSNALSKENTATSVSAGSARCRSDFEFNEFQDILSSRARDSITTFLHQESMIMQGYVRKGVCDIKDEVSQLLQQQARFMEALLSHIEGLTASMAHLQEAVLRQPFSTKRCVQSPCSAGEGEIELLKDCSTCEAKDDEAVAESDISWTPEQALQAEDKREQPREQPREQQHVEVSSQWQVPSGRQATDVADDTAGAGGRAPHTSWESPTSDKLSGQFSAHSGASQAQASRTSTSRKSISSESGVASAHSSFSRSIRLGLQRSETHHEIRRREEEKLITHMIDNIPVLHVRTAATWLLKWYRGLDEPPRTGRLAEIEAGAAFFAGSIIAIALDQWVTIATTNRSAATLDEEMPAAYFILEQICFGWFVFEMLIRMCVHRLWFWCGKNYKMNWLDCFLNIWTLAHLFVAALGTDLSYMRALRVVKMAKVVRMLKALSQVQDLRIMLDCFLTSWYAMLWAIVLMAFIIYMFSLVFVQAMTDYVIRNRDNIDATRQEEIADKFGSVQSGILSLFMALTGGFDWQDVYDLLVLPGLICQVACVFFILLFAVSVWNIVGSIFVEKIMQTARPTPREQIVRQKAQDRQDAVEMKAFFLEFDEDDTETLKENEFVNLVTTGGLSDFMSLRDVDLKDDHDVVAFFNMARESLWSEHNDGTHGARITEVEKRDEVAVDALVSTFLKWKGAATKLEIAVLKHDILARQTHLQDSVDRLAKLLRGERPGLA